MKNKLSLLLLLASLVCSSAGTLYITNSVGGSELVEWSFNTNGVPVVFDLVEGASGAYTFTPGGVWLGFSQSAGESQWQLLPVVDGDYAFDMVDWITAPDYVPIAAVPEPAFGMLSLVFASGVVSFSTLLNNLKRSN